MAMTTMMPLGPVPQMCQSVYVSQSEQQSPLFTSNFSPQNPFGSSCCSQASWLIETLQPLLLNSCKSCDFDAIIIPYNRAAVRFWNAKSSWLNIVLMRVQTRDLDSEIISSGHQRFVQRSAIALSTSDGSHTKISWTTTEWSHFKNPSYTDLLPEIESSDLETWCITLNFSTAHCYCYVRLKAHEWHKAVFWEALGLIILDSARSAPHPEPHPGTLNPSTKQPWKQDSTPTLQYYVTLPWFLSCLTVKNELLSSTRIHKLFLKDIVKDKISLQEKSGTPLLIRALIYS